MEGRLDESESSKNDVIALQSYFKLTWVPDELVEECQYNKCRSPFSKVNFFYCVFNSLR